MPIDIFEFWSQAGPRDMQHPQDREVLSRLKNAHKFDLHCLPYCFVGPLRSAPVVLLYLSPGFNIFDRKQARTSKGRDWVMKCRTGNQKLPSVIGKNYRTGSQYWTSEHITPRDSQIGGYWPPFHHVASPSNGHRPCSFRRQLQARR